MAITNFIPTIWSENLLRSLDKQYIAAMHCNRDYEGEIKNKGSVVKICGVGAIEVDDYTKNTDMSTPQPLSDTVVELTIDQAKYFNFQIDDVDKAQSSPKLMDSALALAASAMANAADKHIYSVCSRGASTLVCNLANDDLLDLFITARKKLYENNVSDNIEVVLEVPPIIASQILKAKIALPSFGNDSLETGYLGSIAGCKVYVSNNLYYDYDGAANEYSSACVMRTTRAVAFAEQFSEIDAYRPEKRFADAVKGLHLYGAKVIYPSEVINMQIGIPGDNVNEYNPM